ncbi:hypothetical protein EV122DRAFT_279706 [Schizophyllum commune]
MKTLTLHLLQWRTYFASTAAIALWYRAYFDLARDGGWLEHLEKLHAQYGPSCEWLRHADIYGFAKQIVKDPELYGAFDQDLSSFGQADPGAAKARRDTLGPSFSRQGIRKFEFVVQEKVDHLIERLLAEGAL